MINVIFNSTIYVGDGKKVLVLDKNQASSDPVLLSAEKARVCVIDVEVMIAAAVEQPVEIKHSILARKFKGLYQHDKFVLQDEKIDENLFQIMAIREQKIKEVYALFPPGAVETCIPYPIALRKTLNKRGVEFNKTIVFVDDLKTERLLTVFDGLKFSRTRIIVNDGEEILSEIKRSQIDFFKKTGEFLTNKSNEYIVLTNSKAIVEEILKQEKDVMVQYLDIEYPAIEGLETSDTSIKFDLPEDTLKKRKEIQDREKFKTICIAAGICAVGLVYFLFNKIEYMAMNNKFAIATQENETLENKSSRLDSQIYRADLRSKKTLNYGITYLSMLEIIPSSYSVNTFKIAMEDDRWTIEMTLFPDDTSVFETIPKIRILKNAEIKDIFINNVPGKHLKITL